MKFTVLIFATFFHVTLLAQHDPDLGQLMTKKLFHCEDVEYNCVLLIPKYYDEQKYDSIHLLLNYWKNRCGASEQIVRTEILMKLMAKNFRQEEYGQLLSEFLKKYKREQQRLDSAIANPLAGELRNANRSFNDFTKRIATEIEHGYTIGSLESAICNFYMNNYRDFEVLARMNVVPEVVRKSPGETSNEEGDDGRMRKTNGDLFGLRFFLYTGLWQPTNKLAKFSIHPMIGTSFGIAITRQAHFDLSIGYAFMQSKPYEVPDGNAIATSRHFENVSIAFEPSFIVYTFPDRAELSVVTGAGTDWLTIVGDKDLPVSKSIRFTSRSMSLGAGMQIPLNKKIGTYLGVQLRHYFLNFENGHGIDLNGDAVTLRITYGAVAAIN